MNSFSRSIVALCTLFLAMTIAQDPVECTEDETDVQITDVGIVGGGQECASVALPAGTYPFTSSLDICEQDGGAPQALTITIRGQTCMFMMGDDECECNVNTVRLEEATTIDVCVTNNGEGRIVGEVNLEIQCDIDDSPSDSDTDTDTDSDTDTDTDSDSDSTEEAAARFAPFKADTLQRKHHQYSQYTQHKGDETIEYNIVLSQTTLIALWGLVAMVAIIFGGCVYQRSKNAVPMAKVLDDNVY